MIKVIAKNVLKEGYVQDFIDLAVPLIKESQKESGCIYYDLYQDISEPNVLTFIEEWKDEKAIRLHKASVHYMDIIPKLAEFMVDKEVRLYKAVGDR
jgi:quinol monooxygenase YgiN